MKTISRIALLTCAAIGICAASYIGLARSGVFNKSEEYMLATYAQKPSQFIDIGDGIKVHVRDEGEGPTILMLHSSMTNLHLWADWASELKKDYRVVRMDWPPYGLTVDQSGKTGTLHAADVVSRVVDHLGLDQMILIGSSSGATLSVIYAAQNPQKVRALALSTLPLKAPPSFEMPLEMKAHLWVRDNLIPNYQPRRYYERSLRLYFGHVSDVKPRHIDLFYDTNNLEGGAQRVRNYLQENLNSLWSKGAQSFAADVKAPILLQWGDLDPVLPKYLVPEAVADFKNTQVTVKHYQLGHYPQIEKPEETVRDLKAYLAALPPITAEAAKKK